MIAADMQPFIAAEREKKPRKRNGDIIVTDANGTRICP